MTNTTDFHTPVELQCITDPAHAMRRTIPALVIMAFAIWLLAALVLGLMFPSQGALGFVGAVVIAVGATGAFYVRKREQLRRTYRDLQRLVLHPGGLRRTDGTVVIDMPWRGIIRFEYRNSALPPAQRTFISPTNPGRVPAAMALKTAHTVMDWGVVGEGTVAPLPGANAAQLRVHDGLGGSDLVGGRAHRSPQCLIFPGEFEADWQRGTVGAWLRHYRPDLLPPAGSPV